MKGQIDISFEIAMLIKELDSSVYSILLNEIKEYDLTPQQLTVIKLIAHNKEMTVTEICNAMSLTKGTVSGILNRMEKLDYIKKIKYDVDKRNTYIVFSEEGLKFAKVFRHSFNNAFNKIFSNVDENQLQEMKLSLEKILKLIKENN